jgi:protein-arginine kinase activator protein McsA
MSGLQGKRTKPHERLTSYELVCEDCGTTFTATRHDARFCSSPCRQRAYRQRRTPNGRKTAPPEAL